MDRYFKNTENFREAALTYKETGKFCPYPVNFHRNSQYMKFWKEQEKRSLRGYTSNGISITGYHYFYMNFSQIYIVVFDKNSVSGKGGKIVGERILDFPRFWDSDYDYYWYIEDAEKQGEHGSVLKCRGRGYSFKAASMLNRNYFLIPGSRNYAVAYEKEYLTKEGLLSKTWEMMDFVNEQTAWGKKRQFKNSDMHRRASYEANIGGVKVEKGYKSEIIGISLKDNPQKIRGKRGKLILFEEAGMFPGMLTAWQIARSSMEQGNIAFGQMLAFGTGGCVCAGTKVWTSSGDLINIEDLKKEQGILGYSGNSVSKEPISYWQKPTKKLCYRITTNTGRFLECSKDHPILKADEEKKLFINKKVFVKTSTLKVNDLIATIEEVPIFGNNRMWNPRIIGWLIGDGTYGKDQTPCLSNCEEEINSFIEKNLTTSLRKQYITKTGKTYKETHLKNLCPILRELGIYTQTKLDKTLPTSIHSYCKQDICELLGGLFDTDGYVSYRTNRKRGSKVIEIGISQASLKLIIEIQLLLQKIGIHGIIRKRLPRKNNPIDRNCWYEFVISDKLSLLSFSKNIKLFIKTKQDRIDKINSLYGEKRISALRGDGVRFERIVSIENIGIQNIYNLTAALTNTYIANGIITHNTKGADFMALEELFYSPEGYNVHSVPNIWDKGRENTKSGFFIPVTSNYEGYYDENGNSDVDSVLKKEEINRNKVRENSTNISVVTQYIAENCITPAEAVLRTTGTIFPINDLKERLYELETNQRIMDSDFVGRLSINSSSGKVEWKPDPEVKPIYDYPIKNNKNLDGAIVIYEHPFKDESTQQIPYGMYIGGCLTPGEKVVTDKGLKNVEDVTLEDKLVNKEGEFVKVINLQQRQKIDHDTYELKMSGTYRTTKFTRGHPIYTSKTPYNSNKTINEKGFDFKFNRADTLDVGDWTKYPNIYNKEISFDTVTLWNNAGYRKDKLISDPLSHKDFWWFVGLWLGDGCCYNDKVSISFNKNEKYYIDKLVNVIKTLFNRSPQLNNNGDNCIECAFNFQQLCNFLEKYFGKYALGKHIPEWVKYAKKEYKTSMVLGYLDSDGCITKHVKGYYSTEFVSINLELLEGFQDIIFSLGIVSSISKLREAKKTYIVEREVLQKECYHLRLAHHSSLELVNQLGDYNDLKIKRIDFNNLPVLRVRPKDGCFLSPDLKYIYFQIREIKHSLYTGTVYNFECETHNYVSHHVSQKNCDPYDHDESTTDSLGSTFILNLLTNRIVAEYTGRPATASQYYENVRRLLVYYNAVCNYENALKGMFTYFDNMHCVHYLADTPKSLVDQELMTDKMFNRKKGTPASEVINKYGRELTKTWLLEPIVGEENIMNLHRIRSIPLLKELIYWNKDINCDRVSAMGMLMILKQDVFRFLEDRKKPIKLVTDDPLWDRAYKGNGGKKIEGEDLGTNLLVW